MVWAEIAKAIPSLVQAGTSIYGAVQSGNRSAYDETQVGQQTRNLAEAKKYLEAAVNPSSPHYRAIQALREAEIRRNTLASIDLIRRQQNRARARGSLGAMVNPERRDESIAGAIAEQFALAGQRAGQQTTADLTNTGNALAGQASQYNPVNTILSQYGNVQSRGQQNLLGAIGGAVQSQEVKDALSGIFGGTKPLSQQQTYDSVRAPIYDAGGISKDIFSSGVPRG